ncbi:hypothetical protein IJ541_06405 [bacterium]|nr:hypothetical protein [bacterium]
MNKKKLENIPTVGLAEVSDYTPTQKEVNLIQNFENQAEQDIEDIKQNINVNFRWSEFEIKRAKKIAKKMGMPYQTYLKATLKQAMDRDEKKYM